MALIDYVLQYAGRGWSAFPLRPGAKLPLISKKQHGRGFHDATTNTAQLEAWWRACPTANIGIATGASGLVVLDADGPEGLAQLHILAAPHGGLPKTLVQRTGRVDGLHFIYRLAPGMAPVKSSSIKGEKLDVRGSTGYIVAPPSLHPTGAQYAWLDATQPIAPLPQWLADWANTRQTGAAGTPQPPGVSPAAPVAAPHSSAGPLAQGTSGVAPRASRGLSAQVVRNLTSGPPFSESEANRLFSALSMLDAASDGATWYSYGAALHDLKWIVNGTDEGFEIWDQWSSTSTGQGPGNGEYKGRDDLIKRWASFDKEYQGSKTTVATIYSRAFGLGWSYEPDQTNVNGHGSLTAVVPPNFAGATFAAPIIWPDRDQWGRPKPTCRNARAALRHMGLDCSHDQFHDKLIIGGQPIEQWAGEVTDNTVHMLRVTIERLYKLDPGTGNTLDAAVQECLQGGFDPVAEYLDGRAWDRVPRLRTWLSTYMGAADTLLNSAIGGLMLIAAVRRVKSPGCKFDQILVLEGPEGRGKSSAIEVLAGTGEFQRPVYFDAGRQRPAGSHRRRLAVRDRGPGRDVQGGHRKGQGILFADAGSRTARLRPYQAGQAAALHFHCNHEPRNVFEVADGQSTVLAGAHGAHRPGRAEAG